MPIIGSHEEHWSKLQLAERVTAHWASLLCKVDFRDLESEVQCVDNSGTPAMPLPPPPPPWKGLAKPNLKAILLLKLLTFISWFSSCAVRELPLRAGNKATNAETQSLKNSRIRGLDKSSLSSPRFPATIIAVQNERWPVQTACKHYL